MYMYLGLLFSLSLLLSDLLQRGNLQCGVMDGFRMGLFLVVVICIFFGCFRVVVYIPPVILIRRGRTIIPTTHRVSPSVRQLFSTTAIQNHDTNRGCRKWRRRRRGKGRRESIDLMADG
jgi:hypothetical protein